MDAPPTPPAPAATPPASPIAADMVPLTPPGLAPASPDVNVPVRRGNKRKYYTRYEGGRRIRSVRPEGPMSRWSSCLAARHGRLAKDNATLQGEYRVAVKIQSPMSATFGFQHR